jgi:hypothetical protein
MFRKCCDGMQLQSMLAAYIDIRNKGFEVYIVTRVVFFIS